LILLVVFWMDEIGSARQNAGVAGLGINPCVRDEK
jgi:hypothetical protein